MRGADAGPWNRLCALPAFWVGLLYDSSSLEAAAELVRCWKYEEIVDLRHNVARSGFKTEFRGLSLQHVADQVVNLAMGGLKRRACLDNAGSDETGFLAPLRGVVQSGRTLSEELLDAFHGRWNKTVDPLFSEFSY